MKTKQTQRKGRPHPALKSELETIFGRNVFFDEPLSQHCSLKIGGPADFFVCIENTEQLRQALVFCNKHDLPRFVLGGGSNLLVPDEGYRGVILKIEQSDSRFDGEVLVAESGAKLNALAHRAADNSLSGLEFLWGIPGTVGGAAIMNAGACGHEIGEIVLSVSGLDDDGEEVTLPKERLQFGYRSSNIAASGIVLTEVKLKLHKSDPASIQERLQSVKQRRRGLYPARPSAGCVFKNPENVSAGKLIDDCGLKGHKLGGAKVWKEHANFIVNDNGASYVDVKKLMELVEEKVRSEYGVALEPEIIDLGEQA